MSWLYVQSAIAGLLGSWLATLVSSVSILADLVMTGCGMSRRRVASPKVRRQRAILAGSPVLTLAGMAGDRHYGRYVGDRRGDGN